MQRTAYFKRSLWPLMLVAPQVAAIAIFILWPAFEAIKLSFYRGDAFGIKEHFVWFANFIALFQNPSYMHSFFTTILFSFCVTVASMSVALLMAVMLDKVIIGRRIYNTLLIWPYAVAPAIAGMLFRFLLSPSIGILTYLLAKFGIHWDYTVSAHQAMFLVIIASAWQQFSYNFVFFVAGLHAIPKSVIEAAAIDGAGPFKRFWTIVFPLLSPTTFFLLVMNLVYSFFSTFGVIQIVTEGGPANATNILIYRVYRDGFVGLDVGGSSAQSVILMIIVTLLVIIQFKYIERKVHY